MLWREEKKKTSMRHLEVGVVCESRSHWVFGRVWLSFLTGSLCRYQTETGTHKSRQLSEKESSASRAPSLSQTLVSESSFHTPISISNFSTIAPRRAGSASPCLSRELCMEQYILGALKTTQYLFNNLPSFSMSA